MELRSDGSGVIQIEHINVDSSIVGIRSESCVSIEKDSDISPSLVGTCRDSSVSSVKSPDDCSSSASSMTHCNSIG